MTHTLSNTHTITLTPTKTGKNCLEGVTFKPCRPIKIVNFNPTNRITVQQNEYLIWVYCIFVQAVCLRCSVLCLTARARQKQRCWQTTHLTLLFFLHPTGALQPA